MDLKFRREMWVIRHVGTYDLQKYFPDHQLLVVNQLKFGIMVLMLAHRIQVLPPMVYLNFAFLN